MLRLFNRKITLTILILIAIIFVLVVVIKQRVGDIRPALLPPSGDISQILEKQAEGLPVNFPLKLPDGFKIGIFAPSAGSGLTKTLGGVRDLEFSPEGTLLVSVPSKGQVLALPDKNSDGVADEIKEVLANLDKPHGLAFFDNKLFVAEETKVVRYNWNSQNLTVNQDKILFNLPKGGRHFTRTIAFNNTGQMFVSVGSTCDVCFEKHPFLAAVIVSDAEGNSPKLFAKGLRNSVFITVNPKTSELWGTEMGRDFLGDNLPPDEVNIIRQDKDYGWPLCYGNRMHDTNFDKKVYIQTVPQPPCGTTEPPVYEIPAHSAPLGLTFINSQQFPADWQGDLLVAYHGSWNRSTPAGYKVVKLNVEENQVLGEEDFITGFLGSATGPGGALGRPVDLTFDKAGSLYISDDKAGVVYKVIKKGAGDGI